MTKSLMTLALCFGVGLGLSPLLRSAHACSCEEGAYWDLELERITGDGDVAVEQAFWPTEQASLAEYVHDLPQLRLDKPGFYTTLDLERLQ